MEKIRIPVPDPFGILGDLTKNMPITVFDPLAGAEEIFREKEKAEQVKESPAEAEKTYIQSQIEKYTYHLEQALRYAPCPGCRSLVISALVGVEIYRRMEERRMKREEFTDEEIEKIKKEIEARYWVR